MKYHFSWSAVHITVTNWHITLTLTLKLKWKSARKHLFLSVKTRIMLKPVNWLSLNVKWVTSTWHKISLKEAFEQALKSPELIKIAKNALKLLKSLKYYFDKIFPRKFYLQINDLRIIFHVQTIKKK